MNTKNLLLLLLVISIFIGCSGDDAVAPNQQFHGSVFVTVKDAAGLPVPGASIIINDLTATTGDDGTYFFTDVSLEGDDYMQVEKTGYFKGSRRFYAKESNTQFVRVTLLPQTEVGSFNASQPSSIIIDNKSRINFPDHAVTYENGTAYNGQVHVFANPIYGDDNKLSDKMPGALTALDQNGEKVALGSVGMLAVEIQSDNGEILKIAEGKTVEVKFAIPNKQLSTAPSTIPLWYFDEAKGYWVQEGEATKDGNTYVGQLPHFSFWNWDVVYTLIEWQGSFKYDDGRPVQNATVCITVESLNAVRCANTDADGKIFGPLPANEALTIDVANDCGNVVFEKEIGPFSNNVETAPFVVNTFSGHDLADISGVALKCDGTPISKGYVRVHTSVNDFMFPILDAAGHYEGRYVYCTGDVITMRVYDVENHLVSLPYIINFNRDLSDVNLKACEVADEYLKFKITGFSQEYVYYLMKLDNGSFNITKIQSLDSIGVKGRFGFTYDSKTTGQFPAYTLSGNQINLPNGQIAYVVNMNLDVTAYEGHGGYIQGNFSGKINKGGNGSGGNGYSDFNGSFQVINH